MYKIKIFIKSSVKKLKKLSFCKGKGLLFCLNFLIRENNPNLAIIAKKLIIFLNDIKRRSTDEAISNKLIEKIYIDTILLSPSKKLKRIKYRAKGRADTIEKRNTFVTLTLNKKDELINENNFYFSKKNYIKKN